MKARIWKDRETGHWCFEVRNPAGRVTSCGFRHTWDAVLSLVLPELYPEHPWVPYPEHPWVQP